MSIDDPIYEVDTTLYLRTPRPAGGYFILWEQDITVIVSEEPDEGSLRLQVEAIDFGVCDIDGIPLQPNGQRLRKNCDLIRPPLKPPVPLHGKEALEWVRRDMLWETLVAGLDMGHIQECVTEQKSAPQGIPGRKHPDA